MNNHPRQKIKIIVTVLFSVIALVLLYGVWSSANTSSLSSVAGTPIIASPTGSPAISTASPKATDTMSTETAPASTSPVSVGPLSIIVVRTQADQELGLGKRASLPATEGMLFVFGRPDLYGIWMKDMQFPIDIIWLDNNLRVVTIKTNVSPDTYPAVFYPAQKSSYVLETNANFSVKNNWREGQSLLFLKQAVNNS